MSLVVSEDEAVAARHALSEERLAHLRLQIRRSVSSPGTVGDRQLDDAIAQAVRAFADSDADALRAADLVGLYFEEIGRRQARRGDDVAALRLAFRTARAAMQRGLSYGIGDAITGDRFIRLREELMTYLNLLYHHARQGLENEHRRVGAATVMPAPLDPDHGDDGPRFNRDQRRALARLEPGEQIRVLVSFAHALPGELCRQPGVVADRDRHLALVPTTWTSGRLGEQLTRQAVLGPMVAPTDAAASASLVWRAARMLTDGGTSDPRMLVPVEDLLGILLLEGDPMLSSLLAAKHLGPWEAIPAVRRLALGEFLLNMLERPQPTNRLARELGIPPQTAHSRIKNLRDLLGDCLDDPTSRLELIVALRQMLPQWRVDASEAQAAELTARSEPGPSGPRASQRRSR
ncbi:helix-turn-helix domain-containing protein [Aeromicrobium sp. YIM 150415]|uniref:helix-turn-helix domain-containing protein n=1 Tax=Aeromicrobium sp. YIM 150415 TaxID=2803912 RepID=UPI001962D8AC|nr:helix-turn-helix domain-containing protein [Aeromicrobium sp. YIM 150415]MBM9462365.1 helix-turn-helix domain-containing protein [Aeromicrobium sp. YIM 150415]